MGVEPARPHVQTLRRNGQLHCEHVAPIHERGEGFPQRGGLFSSGEKALPSGELPFPSGEGRLPSGEGRLPSREGRLPSGERPFLTETPAGTLELVDEGRGVSRTRLGLRFGG